MFRDDIRADVFTQLQQHDLRVFAKLLTPSVFVSAAQRAGLRICTCPLNLINLVWLGLSAAWRQGETFATILTVTLKLLQDQEHFAQSPFGQRLAQQAKANKRGPRRKHDPHGHDITHVSEEAFVQARQRMPLTFWIELIVLLGERFEEQHRHRVRFGDFRLLAIDGTQLRLPQAKALRQHYGTANNAGGQHGPQARLVLLQAPLTRLPVAYQLEPLAVGEVTIARQLVRHLRGDDLLLLDAGFLSYGLLWDVQQRGSAFCLRLQRHLKLETQRQLDGRRDQLVRWTPKDSRGQWRKEGLPKSIELRLIEYQVPGYRTIKLLTNVRDPQVLSYQDLSRLTTAAGVATGKVRPGLYHLRWQIEISYKELKVDQNLKGGLRSKTPAGIAYEVAGHVLLYLLLRWLMVEAAEAHGLDPLRLSFRAAMRELHLMWPTLIISSAAWVAAVLWPRLLQRIASHEVEFRPGRSFPRKKKKRANPKTTKKIK